MNSSEMQVDDNTVFLNVPGKVGRTIKPGDILGDNYCLTDLIGRGGMGIVYRCRHQIIGQDYALKILSPDQVNEQSWQRFQVEGKAIAKLDHPNIVKIFNMGIDGQDCPYYVMELLDGDSLETLIKAQGLLSLAATFDIFTQVASGLTYAHSRGIVHRDIKPSNIMLQRGGGDNYSVKIVDFGLAKLVDRHNLTGQSLTGDGEVIGSPFYMSPEQGMGTDVDARSDIYSLGCTLFKTLTGNPPFCGESAFKTIMMHQNEAVPSLASAAPGQMFPQSLELLVQKMLAKRPEERYQSMAQVGHDISRLQEGKTLAKRTLAESGTAPFVKTGTERGLHHGRELRAEREAAHAAEADTVAVAHGSDSARKIPWLIVTAACLIITVCAVTISQTVNKSDPIPSTAGSATVQPQRDLQMEKAIANFSKFKAQPTETCEKNGRKYLKFHFPETSIGNLANDNGNKREAVGDTEIQVLPPIILEIDKGAHRSTWLNPWILKKVDGKLVNTLRFYQVWSTDLLVEKQIEGSTEDDQPITAMLAIARGWTNLQAVGLCDCRVSSIVLDGMQSLPHIVHFYLRGIDFQVRDWSKYTFLRKLSELHLTGLRTADPILNSLRHSKNLRSLHLESTPLDPEGIDAVTTMTNLDTLAISKLSVNPNLLAKIDTLPHLHDFWFGPDQSDHTRISDLAVLKHLIRLHIQLNRWHSAEIEALKRAIPQCEILNLPPSKNDAEI